MRLNARKHGTRIISDRKAETWLWRGVRDYEGRWIALCATTCVTTGRAMCVCGKVISRRDCLPGRFVVEHPTLRDAEAKRRRRRSKVCLSKMSAGVWQAKEINQAPLCVRGKSALHLNWLKLKYRGWTDWALARILWGLPGPRSGLKVGIPLGLTCQVDSRRSAWCTDRFIYVIMSKST